MKKTWFQTLATILILFGMTTALFLYTSGYRIKKGNETVIDLSKTGIVSSKSIPDSASVFVDGTLTTATDDNISGLKPGKHILRIEKKGFVPWQKEIEVFEQLVTDITAVLVSQTPRLEPLTNTGVLYPSLSPLLNKIAYFSNEESTKGIKILLMDNSGIGIFKNNPETILLDTPLNKYSQGTKIEWSPDERELLITNPNNTHYMYDIGTKTTRTITDPEKVRIIWEEEKAKKREDFVSKLEIPESLLEIAKAKDTLWSPDLKKFIYKTTDKDNVYYKIVNLEKPLPIGEKVETIALKIPISEELPNVAWYTDSYHLIVTRIYNKDENKGTVHLVRLDGTNNTEIYNNILFDANVYPNLSGDKVIILTSFKSQGQTDLYTVSIR